VQVGRNATTNRPLVQTFRDFNRANYWAALEPLPPVPPLRFFPIVDSFIGDSDVGTWKDAIHSMGAKLGLRGVMLTSNNGGVREGKAGELGNFTRELLRAATGAQLIKGGALSGYPAFKLFNSWVDPAGSALPISMNASQRAALRAAAVQPYGPGPSGAVKRACCFPQ
jgi:hypothetical protein